jgi:hypothetical protein
MAATNVTSATKARTYHRLFRLNHAFRSILFNCEDLQQIGAFRSDKLREYAGLAQELQAQINHELLHTLQQIESRDAFRFGQSPHSAG